MSSFEIQQIMFDVLVKKACFEITDQVVEHNKFTCRVDGVSWIIDLQRVIMAGDGPPPDRLTTLRRV